MSESKSDATDVHNVALDLVGPTAMPRRNGELVFNEPWESRVFGIAVALCESGLFDWDEFRDCLIAEIARAEADFTRVSSGYYERFSAALERLLIAKSVCLPADFVH